MHIKSLKVFCDVVGWRSFSRAADENGISQSGASQVVNQLERRLGVKLIDRSKRPFVLTPEGETYYEGCRKLVQRYDALEDQVRTLHEEVAGRVRVVSIYSVGLHHMSRYLQQFLTQYPKANVRLEYQHPHRLYDAVEKDHADLGLVSYPRASRTIEAIAWREEPMVLVCAPGHRLADYKPSRSRTWPARRMIGFDSELTIRREIDRVLQLHDAEVHVAMEFDNIETIKRAVEIDAGVALLPEPTVLREVDTNTLVMVPLVATTSWFVRWASFIVGARNWGAPRGASSSYCRHEGQCGTMPAAGNEDAAARDADTRACDDGQRVHNGHSASSTNGASQRPPDQSPDDNSRSSHAHCASRRSKASVRESAMESTALPDGSAPRPGLYDPANEHDACGVGFVVNMRGEKSHEIVRSGLEILVNLTHRGACGCDPLTGDGAGILTQIPHDFFQAKAARTGHQAAAGAATTASASSFCPATTPSGASARRSSKRSSPTKGKCFLGWRDVPVDNSVHRASRPAPSSRRFARCSSPAARTRRPTCSSGSCS